MIAEVLLEQGRLSARAGTSQSGPERPLNPPTEVNRSGVTFAGHVPLRWLDHHERVKWYFACQGGLVMSWG